MSVNKTIRMFTAALMIWVAMMSLVQAAAEGFYAGVQVGQTNLNNVAMLVKTGSNGIEADFPIDDTNSCDFGNNPPGCVLTDPTNTGIGERLFFGSNINKYAGFEIGFTNYANSQYDPPVTGGTHQPQIRVYSMEILGKLMYPIYKFSVFAKGGVGIVYQSISPALQTSNDENTGETYSALPAAGIGVSFDITPNWEVDVSANKIFKGDDIPNTEFYALGISYHWVAEYCGQFLC